MAVNVATLESLGAVYGVLKDLTRPVEVLMVNVARGAEQLETLFAQLPTAARTLFVVSLFDEAVARVAREARS